MPGAAVLLANLLFASSIFGRDYPSLDPEQVNWIADRIFANECNSKPECLTSWNAGEDFPSLGIGHFIWYRQDQQDIFTESFPDLMTFMASRGIEIPRWIASSNGDAPWQNREQFQAEYHQERLSELRDFLLRHRQAQMAFIIQRFTASLDAILVETGPELEEKTRLENNFYAVANAQVPAGMYALIDYVNFKGTGASATESYRGQGWGLRQVLLNMDAGPEPLASFVESAKKMLTLRVANAPEDRQEQRWLKGWQNRLDTYLELPGFQDIPHRQE